MTNRHLDPIRIDRHTPGHRARPAFARVEAVALACLVLLMAALMLATSPYQRRTAMLNRDLANLRQIGAWTFAYANDFEDLHPSFTSAPNSQWPRLRPSGNPISDAARQAIDIIRRRTGRSTFPLPAIWVPNTLYTHLVLADYADRFLPDPIFVATGDKHRMKWLDDPQNKHDLGFWQPFQNPTTGTVSSNSWRWPYSSSFQTPSGFWDKNPSPSSVSQTGSSSAWAFSGNVFLGPMPLSDVAYPAQKTLLHASGSWYASRQAQYFLAESSAVTVLMTDGSAALRRTSEANAGWGPRAPTSANSSVFTYTPRPWQPPAIDPGGTDTVKGYYRWTRGRLDGRDFDGPEINTGQK